MSLAIRCSDSSSLDAREAHFDAGRAEGAEGVRYLPMFCFNFDYSLRTLETSSSVSLA
jgi:hypothetical protein